MLKPGMVAESFHRSDAPDAARRSDDELVVLAVRKPELFGELYDRYYGRILNYAYRRVFDVVLAEEITSSTFFKALRGLRGYDLRGKFGAWLYRIAGNEIRLHWRARRRRLANQGEWRKEYGRVRFAAGADESAEQIEEQARAFARVHAALRELPERYQTALALRYFEGMSYEEVAEVMERKVGSVKSLVHRGLKRLGRKLDRRSATLPQ